MLSRFHLRSVLGLSLRFLLLSSLWLTWGGAQADEGESEQAQRYADVQRCMARGLGPHWDRTYQITQVRNRWGGLEPTARSLESAPQGVRITELRCRYQAGLQDAERP